MKKFRRRKYIVEPSFQMKVALVVAMVFLLISFVYFILVGGIFDLFANLSVYINSDVKDEILAQKEHIVFLIIIWQIVTLVFLFASCIFISHKVAGPIYKLKMFLKELIQKGEIEEIRFRKDDFFRELAPLINQTFSKLRAKSQVEIENLEDVKNFLNQMHEKSSSDKKQIIQEIQERLTLI